MTRIGSRHSSPVTRQAALARTALVLLVASFALGCGSKDEEAATDTAGTAEAAASSSAAEGESSGSVHLEVSGGPHAGTYDAQMTSGGCSHGLAGEGAWGNQYSIDTSDPKAFSSLQLIVPDTKAAGAGTSAFKMTASFGPLFGTGSTSYDIDTRPDANTKRGSGRVTVDDRGQSGRVTFDGKTAEGIGLKGTIDCRTVMRAG